MLKRLVYTILGVALILPTAVLALPAAPNRSGSYTVPDALLDAVGPSTATAASNAQLGLMGYVMAFHDSNYQYSMPLCANALMESTTGATIQSVSVFSPGDNLIISIGPSQQSASTECITTVVRVEETRAANGSDCLQNFQVNHAVAPPDKQLLLGKQYVFNLTVYSRPTLACDAGTYGTTPITASVATDASFTVTINQGSTQIQQLTVTTGSQGLASFNYTFNAKGQYTIQITPQGGLTPGNSINWTEQVGTTTPSPLPVAPAKVTRPPASSPWPYVIFFTFLFLILAGSGLTYWYRLKKQRENELPVDEYLRAPKL